MAPTVYWMPISPPARSVLLCAAASGIELNLKELDLFKGEHLTPEYLKKGIHAEGVKEITPYQRQQLREAFEIAEKYLENSKWAAGDELTIADFCFASSITSWANYERLDQSRYPKINAWLREMEKLPYFKPTNDPGIQEYAELVKKKLAELSITL